MDEVELVTVEPMWIKVDEELPTGETPWVIVCKTTDKCRYIKDVKVVKAVLVRLFPEDYDYWIKLPGFTDINNNKEQDD